MENHLKNELTGWHTIVEIRDATGLPEEGLRTLAHRGTNATGEEWARLEGGQNASTLQFVINTDSPEFQHYAQEQKPEDEFDPFMDVEEETAYPFPLSVPLFGQPDERPCRDIWPELCQWLLEQGVSVFWNALEDTTDTVSWQWQWGHLSGEGYESEKAAILAAIQAKITQQAEDLVEASLLNLNLDLFADPSPQPAKAKRRFLW